LYIAKTFNIQKEFIVKIDFIIIVQLIIVVILSLWKNSRLLCRIFSLY